MAGKLESKGRLRFAAVLVTGLALLLLSCTVQLAAAPPASRDIRVSISGLHFVPDQFDVRVGETIRFVVTNPTDLPHELFIGTMPEQVAHHQEVMKQSPVDQVQLMDHTGYGIYLMAGDSGQFIYHFAHAGAVIMGCHVPGHWEGGMIAIVSVHA